MKIPIYSIGSKPVSMALPDYTDIPRIHYATEAYVFNRILFVPSHAAPRHFYESLFIKQTDDVPKKFIDNLSKHKCITMKGTYFYAAQPFDYNYSHFTLQCLGPILHAFHMNILSPQIKIIAPLKSKFHHELYLLHGLDYFDISDIDKNIVYCFNSIFYSDLHFYYTGIPGVPFHKEYIELYEQSLPEIQGKNDNIKIYLTRINNNFRKLVNESEVIDYLTARGFTICDFDRINVEEQIKLIRGASTIIAPHGASGANLAYKSSGNFKFVELFGNRFVNWHVLLLMKKNCLYSGIRGIAKSTDYDSPYSIDLNLIDQALDHDSVCFKQSTLSKENSQNQNPFNQIVEIVFNSHYCGCNTNARDMKQLITWHKTRINIAPDLKSLSHNIDAQSGITFELHGNSIRMYIPAMQQYIVGIDKRGFIALSSSEHSFPVIYNCTNNISILLNDAYLSARKDGTFGIQPHNKIWEHFLVIQPSVSLN